jgi:Protein of unknown function (DUF2800)
MSAHAKLAPSDAKRWLHCAAAVAFTDDIPNKDTEYAQEGTRAHALAAEWLNGNLAAKPLDTDEGMADFVAIYVNTIKNKAEGKILLVEQRLDVSKFTTEVGGKGTGDAIIIDTETCDIDVNDLKYGKGVVVYAEHNEQMMLYGLGALVVVEGLLLPQVRNIRLTIHQPRLDHIDEWTISREDLLAFGVEARKAGKLALDILHGLIKIAPEHFSPAPDTCRWCAGKAKCPALQGLVIQNVLDDFQDLSAPEAVTKSPRPDPVPSFGILDLIDSWVGAVRAYIFERLSNGVETPGWKLVAGKGGSRKWRDEKEAIALAKKLGLKNKVAFDTSFKSAPALEKVIPKTMWPEFENLITKSDPKPTPVAATDKRQAITLSSKDDFQDLT